MPNESQSLLDESSYEDQDLARVTKEVEELRDVIHKGIQGKSLASLSRNSKKFHAERHHGKRKSTHGKKKHHKKKRQGLVDGTVGKHNGRHHSQRTHVPHHVGGHGHEWRPQDI